MAVLPIRIFGDPALHSPALPITAFDDDLRVLVADMVDTMHAAPGVGLAAPQVGVGLRLFVYEYTDTDDVVHSGTAVNPVLLVSPPPVEEADEDLDSEGCLSFPGERFPLVRSADALLRAFTVTGEPFEVAASGWLARIFQHEYDHLDGYLYVDRLEFSYAKAAGKIARKRSWGGPGQKWMPGVDTFEGGA
ncbi:peptide deformylase [Subtercola boreus]|uniref:Peptide deformylase n=1 Tax=Subtercola boreus TaxID=120213 RepID=A0A3E0WBH6_9MICO|nr:peptide deformylase [Subtercola boreus]RFA20803.1 peptide deformylase [Subtercola boreus]RFA20918.1 peptide deformylase [Subtercola boreus]RFA27111.1 peptide deformylase [Subtercola boreus]